MEERYRFWSLALTMKRTLRCSIPDLVRTADGQVKKVANATYVVTPKNVDVSGDQPEAAAPAEAAPVEAKQPRELFR